MAYRASVIIINSDRTEGKMVSHDEHQPIRGNMTQHTLYLIPMPKARQPLPATAAPPSEALRTTGKRSRWAHRPLLDEVHTKQGDGFVPTTAGYLPRNNILFHSPASRRPLCPASELPCAHLPRHLQSISILLQSWQLPCFRPGQASRPAVREMSCATLVEAPQQLQQA